MIDDRGIPEQDLEDDAGTAPVMVAEPDYEPEIQLEPEGGEYERPPIARRMVRGMVAVAPAIASAGERISAALPEGDDEDEVDIAGENPEEVMSIDKDTAGFLFGGTDEEFMGNRDEDIDELTGEDEETDDFLFNPKIDEVAGNVEGVVGGDEDESRVMGWTPEEEAEEENTEWTGFKREGEGESVGGMQEVQQTEVGAPKSVYVPAHYRHKRSTRQVSQMGQLRGY